MQLTRLSLQRVAPGKAPVAPNNDERVRSFRAVSQASHSNSFPWAHRNRAEYDPAPETETVNFADRRGA